MRNQNPPVNGIAMGGFSGIAMTTTTFGDKRTQRQQKIQERMLRNRNLLGIPQENRLRHIL